MASHSNILPVSVRSIAIVVGVLAILLLPIAELGSGFLLGNVHPSFENVFVFSGRWAFDASCIVAVGLASASWCRLGLSLLLLIGAIALPIAGRAWLMHVDSIVSY
jgi:hypothetical protein